MDVEKHPTYEVVTDPEKADAVGWGFYEPDVKKMTKIYFKFPELGSDELRIKIHYAGLCHSEIHTVCGDWGPMLTKPLIPGHEIAGEVTHVGSNVTDFKKGDMVGFGCFRDFCGDCRWCKRGDDHFCDGPSVIQKFTYGPYFWGGYATALQNPAKLFFHLPKNLPIEKVAPLFCAGITMYNPVERYCKEGDEVAITGMGGLGHIAVKYAKAWGCKVTCFTTSKDKVDLCKSLGADKVVVCSDDKVFDQEAGKYDVILNTVSDVDQKLFDNYSKILGPLGTWVQLGAPVKKVEWAICQLVFNEQKYVGSLVGSKKQVQAMLDFSSKHEIYPICEQFDFEDFPKAWDKLNNGKPHFRCVVKCLDGK